MSAADRQALHDAAKAAALAERDRLQRSLGWPFPSSTDYVVGRLVEAALAVIEGRPIIEAEPVVDVTSEEA